MKKRGRRILCLMMAMLMILTSMPATAMAATEESASELGNSSNVEAFQEETADAAVSFEEEQYLPPTMMSGGIDISISA